jgi:hypothetical protein
VGQRFAERIGGEFDRRLRLGTEWQHLQQQGIPRVGGPHPPHKAVRDEQREEFGGLPGAAAQRVGQAQAIDQDVGIADGVGQLLLPGRRTRRKFNLNLDDGLQTGRGDCGVGISRPESLCYPRVVAQTLSTSGLRLSVVHLYSSSDSS